MDTLTGLATRKELLAQYERLTAEGVTSARPIALIVANLDHFKPINMQGYRMWLRTLRRKASSQPARLTFWRIDVFSG